MEQPQTDQEKYYIARINILIQANDQLQDQLANASVELQKLRDEKKDHSSDSES